MGWIAQCESQKSPAEAQQTFRLVALQSQDRMSYYSFSYVTSSWQAGCNSCESQVGYTLDLALQAVFSECFVMIRRALRVFGLCKILKLHIYLVCSEFCPLSQVTRMACALVLSTYLNVLYANPTLKELMSNEKSLWDPVMPRTVAKSATIGSCSQSSQHIQFGW